MGAACELAEAVGASGIYFGRITNWGTFNEAEYAAKAVFLQTHPEHDQFLEAMQDARLRRPYVQIGNLAEFFGDDQVPVKSWLAA